MDEKLISIVVSVYNSEAYLEQCLSRILSILWLNILGKN